MKVTTLLVFNNIFKTEFEQAYLLAHFSFKKRNSQSYSTIMKRKAELQTKEDQLT